LKSSDEYVAGSLNHERKAARNSSDSASGGALTELLLQLVEDIIETSGSLIEVYSDRLRLSVRSKVVAGAITGGAAVCVALWLGAAALATLRGMCGGFTALWGGREWLGDLTGGLLALTLTACAVATYLRSSSRRKLRQLKAKYERIRHEHSQKNDSASSADDGEGVARS
jgi:hypothetical protein